MLFSNERRGADDGCKHGHPLEIRGGFFCPSLFSPKLKVRPSVILRRTSFYSLMGGGLSLAEFAFDDFSFIHTAPAVIFFSLCLSLLSVHLLAQRMTGLIDFFGQSLYFR